MKKIISVFLGFIFILISSSSANADPTYAMLDANGNVTNVIVCGAACAGGTFNGQRVVLQVAENPVTHENAGGVWQGPGTTTYNDNTGVFTVRQPETTAIINTYTEVDSDNNEIISSATMSSNLVTFTYNDTIENPNFIKFKFGFEENSKAILSVIKKSQNSTVLQSESITFENRKTSQQVASEINSQQLTLMTSKIEILIRLLDNWIK